MDELHNHKRSGCSGIHGGVALRSSKVLVLWAWIAVPSAKIAVLSARIAVLSARIAVLSA
ncbi:hypothetical protein Gbro_3597 [Gordonia bronchialis DSM 43247]|uniref:Uncharacterized protein n=1 Tax=Gordonia bronchialis (strain ATCC 25592 / DSM 43247 / BCRC 13721 / JCM 3198 / KCTC 3076 / NBRC 16047 / NCTC 10667) TaxID=526226 RepID=D0LF92_GORB4|nr:hypothetical protein Gbro_3597 [Gordonia bronchialis DSM 43247]